MKNQSSIFRRLLTALVLLVYCTGLSSVILPLIEYAADYQRIALEECDNLDLPELECNGKCYLAEQITKQTAPETKLPGKKVIAQKSGVDPHYSQSINFCVSNSMNSVLPHSDSSFSDIILSRIDPPPQC